jgi:hypothetical protein
MATVELTAKYFDLFSSAFPGKEVSEKTIAVYVHYCQEIPDEQFILACDECIKNCRFFPTIAEIFEKAEPHMGLVRYERKQKYIEETREAAQKMIGGV